MFVETLMREETRKVSKLMSYLLRHNPADLEVSPDGFLALSKLAKGASLGTAGWMKYRLRKVVHNDEKGEI